MRAHLDGLNSENTFHCWLYSSLYNCVCDKKKFNYVFLNLRWPKDSAYIYIYIYIYITLQYNVCVIYIN